MIGGRRALLLLAVLGVGTVRGGPLKHRADIEFHPQQTAFENSTTTTATTSAGRVPPGRPAPVVIPTPTATVVEEETVQFSVAYEAGVQQTDTENVAAPIPIPTRPGLTPPKIPPQLVISVESASLNFGTPAGVDAGAASPTSTEDEYVYPGVWGASGTLLTDVNAPSRSVDATIKTVAPVQSSARGPPPSEPSPSGDGFVYAPAATTTATTNAGAVPTPPRGGPPKIVTTAITRSTSTSFDLGGGGSEGPQSAQPQSYLPSQNTSSSSSAQQATQNATGPTRVFTRTPPVPIIQTQTIPTITSTPSAISYCQASDLTRVQTTYSIVYTSTITWVGNPDDYTPEYPPIATPAPPPPCSTVPTPARLTVSTIAFCSSTGTGTKFVTCLTTTSTYNYAPQITASTEAAFGPGFLGGGTVTIITTDKNPAVVFTTPKPADYGVNTEVSTRGNHGTADGSGTNTAPSYNTQPSPGPMRQPPTTDPVTVGVQPTAVIINGNTIVDDPSGKTQVVIVSGVTFTIGPTQVVGGGATIDRPALTGGVNLPTPTTTTIGGLHVVVSSSVAVVGGSSFTLGSTPRTAVVSGQTVVISPTAVAVGSQTFTLPTYATPTEVVVAGGDLVTAIGQSVVVIQSTTITYGLTGTSTTVIDDDTITFGPGGVTIHGSTIGGKTAKAGATDFAIVGGATITKVGASVAVIGGSTYTIGPGTGTTTTVIGGETITISPDGIAVSTLSLPWPFGPTTVITPGATAGEPTATATSSAAKDDAAAGLRPDMSAFMAAVGLAVGIIVLGV